MINNITKTQSTFRLVAGITLLTLFVVQIITGTTGLILFSLSGVLLISGVFRSCPITYFKARAKAKF